MFPCPNCQASLPQDAKFCAACGHSIRQGGPPAGQPAGARPVPRTVALDVAVLPQLLTEVVVGRDVGSTIAIDHPIVSSRHLKISRAEPRGLLVEDLGSTNGTFVNGTKTQREVLSLRDHVHAGSVPISLADPRIARLLVDVKRTQGVLVLGSDERADVVVRDPEVAPRHAQLDVSNPGAFVLRELDGATYVDSAKFRAKEIRLNAGSTILLGSFPIPLEVIDRQLRSEDEPVRAEVQAKLVRAFATQQTLVVGRADDADVVAQHGTISAHHARLTKRAGGEVWVEDLGSLNGTWIDGVRVTKAGSLARPNSRIAIGALEFVVGTGGQVASVGRAKVRIDLCELGLVVKDRGSGTPRALLERVSFSVLPGELIGMLGPSGAGKSTLLMTVLGLLRPTNGHVLLNGRPLAEQYESFRTNVGYVPQDDIVHPQLTVHEALLYACKLRLPKMPIADIEHAIERTLRQVGLYEQRNLQIGSAEDKVLSGGQRRRVNLAVELVTDPSLLILDEPTSGLSWTDAAEVVATLKRLADDGRTVVLTIHQPDYQEYEKFNAVAILGRGGKLLFFGPPNPESYEFFGASPSKPREMFDHVEQLDGAEWRARFEGSNLHKRFVGGRSPSQAAHSGDGPPPKTRRRSSWGQFPTLLGRSWKLTMRNKTALVLLLIQAPLLGLLIGLTAQGSTSFRVGMFGCKDSRGRVDQCEQQAPLLACDPEVVSRAMTTRMTARDPISRPEQRVLNARVRDPRTGLLAILMALFLPMVIASSNVLVTERTVYERERLAGLNIIPYVLARFLVLAVLGAVVTTLHLGVALPFLGLRGPAWVYWAVGAMTTSSAAALGLCLSAAVKSAVSALWGINFLVIPQLLFAGSIARLSGVNGWLSWLTTTRYGLEALAHVDLSHRAHLVSCQVERYMENLPNFVAEMPHPVLRAFMGTQSLTVLALLATMVLLRLKDKG